MSNKTPKKQDDATESAPKRKSVHIIVGVILLSFGLYVLFSGIQGLTDKKQRLYAPEGSIVIEIADTPESRTQGLSGRESIGANEGLMFVFDNPSVENCFWMKDMNFSIDMVWLDENKTVVTVSEDVSPETYPETFCPEMPAKYGLELQANRAENLGINIQEQLRF